MIHYSMRLVTSLRPALIGLVFCLVSAVAAAAPATVLIRVPPAMPLPKELAPLLAKWRLSGQVAGVLFLTHGRSDNPAHRERFEAFAVLEFLNERSCDIWEKEWAPALPVGLIVRRADVLAHGELSPRDSNQSVFFVNTYTPLVPAARFNEFVQGYVKPLYEVMRGTKHLVRYTAYLERGETGKVDALNVLEYRDQAAFDAVTAMKTRIREQVAAAVPTYGQFDRIKDTLRVDGFSTAATRTALPEAR